MTWLLTAIALAGVVLNIRRNRWGFALWTASNAGWTVREKMATNEHEREWTRKGTKR